MLACELCGLWPQEIIHCSCNQDLQSYCKVNNAAQFHIRKCQLFSTSLMADLISSHYLFGYDLTSTGLPFGAGSKTFQL